ncbi:MAG: adhesin, partial [Acidobacteria bacterium]
GTLTVNADGSFTYTPNPNFNGTDSFTYQAKDAAGALSNSATVTITVNAVNDAPVATNDAYTTNEDTALTVAAPGVLGNDTDVDVSDTRTAVLVAASGPTSGSLALNPDGSFTYTPSVNFNGTDSFTYQAKDAAGALSNVATVTITVNTVNDLPTITDIVNQTVNEDTATAALAFTIGDVETAATALTVTTASSNLTLVPAASIVVGGAGASRTVTVTPAANQSGTATITVTVKDADGGTASDSFLLTVSPVNDAPVAANDAYTTNEDTALTIAA